MKCLLFINAMVAAVAIYVLSKHVLWTFDVGEAHQFVHPQFPAQHSVLPKLSVKLLFNVVMQQHLMNMVHNAQVDDILLILAVADAHSALHLHSMCLQVIAHSELSILTLEKELSKSAMEEVVDLRRRLGIPELDMDSPQAKRCKQIYRQCLHLISHLGLRF
jgi:hypothetical protein